MGRKRLGRGLDALLGESASESGSTSAQVREMAVESLRPGRFQPRGSMDPERLRELADSIATQGVVQPILVRTIDDSVFEIIAGERRWRAAQMAGLTTVPVIERDVPDRAVVAIALIENIQREDLNPLEEARALSRLIQEFGLTHEQTAKAVGRSRTAVTNLLRLLDLEPEVCELVDRRQLDMGHARALLAAERQRQIALARKVVAQGLSVRQTEQLVRAPERSARRVTNLDPDVARLENQLRENLAAPVKIRQRSGGKGQLVISYQSLEELDSILDRMGVRTE